MKDLKVTVGVHFHKKEALERAKVCKVDRKNGAKGVAILVGPPSMTSVISFIILYQTPFRLFPPRPKNRLFFVVDVTFPSPSHGIRHVPSFALDFRRFVLDVDNLSGYSFRTLALKSSNRPVFVNVS